MKRNRVFKLQCRERKRAYFNFQLKDKSQDKRMFVYCIFCSLSLFLFLDICMYICMWVYRFKSKTESSTHSMRSTFNAFHLQCIWSSCMLCGDSLSLSLSSIYSWVLTGWLGHTQWQTVCGHKFWNFMFKTFALS